MYFLSSFSLTFGQLASALGCTSVGYCALAHIRNICQFPDSLPVFILETTGGLVSLPA
jgi:hypothetical protein